VLSVVLQTCILFIHKESEKKKENPTHNLSMLPRYARACHTKEGVYIKQKNGKISDWYRE
jgi:hypothetical protein